MSLPVSGRPADRAVGLGVSLADTPTAGRGSGWERGRQPVRVRGLV